MNETIDRSAERETMVERQIRSRGIHQADVLEAMGKVPRHRFVPEEQSRHAYADHPLPIGHGQTISQPFVVAYMTQALGLEPADRVLEIGTGSGYQAAVLAELVLQVYSIEILAPLAEEARETLRQLGYQNVEVRAGDGYQGWNEAAPFDAIIVTAAPDHVPQPLLDQLAVGGRMVLPVGEDDQELLMIERSADGIERSKLLPVRFVPMTGQAQAR